MTIVVTPVLAHEDHEFEVPDDPLPACEVPDPGLFIWDPAIFEMMGIPDEILADPELLFHYIMSEFGVEEILATDPEHDEFHLNPNVGPVPASIYSGNAGLLIDYQDAGFTTLDRGGCHPTVREICWWPLPPRLCRIHYRHCPADKCGGHDCP